MRRLLASALLLVCACGGPQDKGLVGRSEVPTGEARGPVNFDYPRWTSDR